jgi:hypothetical protein
MMTVRFARLARRIALAAILLASARTSARAQHDRRRPASSDTARGDRMPCEGMEEMKGMPGMEHCRGDVPDLRMYGPLGLSTFRQGSGTSWVPDAVNSPFYHVPLRGWDVMAHGLAFGQLVHQSGARGDTQLGSINWSMVMGSRPLVGGRLQLRAMNSLEAWTVTDRGYPILLQSGETLRGDAIHDRQHPHDFFMELGAFYERALSPSLAWQLYVAPSGEPALGPVAFMHRPSAENDPMVSLGHHWQDATHITFGVVTAGLFSRRWKLEGSAFNGREPDENRWNLDLRGARLDSYSGRLTVNPNASWSLSGSYGFIHAPERPRSETSMHRLSASALHGARIGSTGRWSSALVWGANLESGHAALEHSFLAETNFEPSDRHALFGRVELVQKTGEDLSLGIGDEHEEFDLLALSAGYVREVGTFLRTSGGVGVRGTLNILPAALEPHYGSRTPLGVVVFLRLRPATR